MIGSRPDTQIITGGNAVEVQRGTFKTRPSGVIFDLLIPMTAWDAEQFSEYADNYAAAIETYMAGGRAIDASFVEDLDTNGLVIGFLDFTIQTPPVSPEQTLPLTAEIRIPIEYFGDRILIDRLVEPAFEKTEAALRAWASH